MCIGTTLPCLDDSEVNKAMKINTVIFDCDGTLLDTFQDLKNAVNYALKAHNYPLHDDDYVRLRIGHGVSNLVKWTMPESASEAEHQACLKTFESYYADHIQDATQPYPHMLEVLQELLAKGYKIAIVSNKYQDGVTVLNHDYFDDLFTVAIGTTPDIERKTAPDMVIQAMKELSSQPEESIYVGDTEVDVKTAQNANLPCIGVTWGFRDRETLTQLGCQYVIDDARQIISTLETINQG